MAAPSLHFVSYEGVSAAPQACDLQALCGTRVSLARWAVMLQNGDRAGVACGVAACNTALADPQSAQQFGSALASALEVALGDTTKARLSLSLLGAFCYLAVRHLPSEGGGVTFLPRVLGTLGQAVEELLLRQSIAGDPALTVGATLEAAVAQVTSKRQLAKGTLQPIFDYLLRQNRRHGLLRVISRCALTHDAAAAAICACIDAGGERRQSAFMLLCTCLHRMQHAASVEPAASVACLNFLQEVGRRSPSLLASGFESGIIHDSLRAALCDLPGRQKVASQKGALSLLGCVLEALPPSLLDQRSLREAAKLLHGRATDTDVDIGSRAHALGELTDLIVSYEVYPPSAAAEYVQCCESILELTATDGRASKQLLSRCVPALVALLSRTPWEPESEPATDGPRAQELAQSGEAGKVLAAQSGPSATAAGTSGSGAPSRLPVGSVSLDLAALEAQTVTHAPPHYVAWLEAVSVHVDMLLEHVADESLLQLLQDARLGQRDLQALLRALLAAGSSNSSSEGGGASAEATKEPSVAPQLRLLLRAHVLGHEAAASVGGGVGGDGGGVSGDGRGRFERAARQLVELSRGSRRSDCVRLLEGLSMSEAEVVAVAEALYAEALESQATDHEAALKLLARCADRTPRAVLRVVPLHWLESQIDAIVDSAHPAQPCLRPLLQLLAAALRGGCTCQSNLLWIERRAPQLILAGAVNAAIDAIFAYPPLLAQVTHIAPRRGFVALASAPECPRP